MRPRVTTRPVVGCRIPLTICSSVLLPHPYTVVRVDDPSANTATVHQPAQPAVIIGKTWIVYLLARPFGPWARFPTRGFESPAYSTAAAPAAHSSAVARLPSRTARLRGREPLCCDAS